MDTDWNVVWDRKGATESSDHFEVSGFEHFRDFDTAAAADVLIDLLQIKPEDKVLEIGAGAGLIGRHLQTKCNYVASDRSASMVAKSIELNRYSAVCFDADDIVFKDKSFDKVFAFGVFHYFPDYAYARRAIDEMIRVARVAVCVIDLPTASHEPDHLLFDESFFADWIIGDSLYKREHKRFSALKVL